MRMYNEGVFQFHSDGTMKAATSRFPDSLSGPLKSDTLYGDNDFLQDSATELGAVPSRSPPILLRLSFS